MGTREPLIICMGSACHQLGVYDVLPKLKELLHTHHLDDTIELKGGFCLGPCAQGIVMRYRDRLFTGIRPHNVEERFAAEILPALTDGRLSATATGRQSIGDSDGPARAPQEEM